MTVIEQLRSQYGPIWVAANGDLYPVAKMTLRHIHNGIKYIDRQLAALPATLYSLPVPNGDMTEDGYWRAAESDDSSDQRNALVHARETLENEVRRREQIEA